MGLMPAYGHTMFSLKAICILPANPARGLDSHQGTVTLFAADTGIPTAILNASAITEIRTAAVTALATRTLARAQATVLAIIGGGVQARSHLRALADVRPWREVRAYSPALAAGSRELPGAAVAAGAREAVDGADVVVTVTSSPTPVIEHAWLAPDAHVNAVGASTPAARELEPETVAAAALFCDSRESVAAEAGEYRLAIERELIPGAEHIRAELGEVLVAPRAGPTDDDTLTLFRSLGIGVEDLAAAHVAVANARRLQIGTEVEL